MRLSRMVTLWITTLGVLPAGGAFGQNQQYDTSLYAPQTPGGSDNSYGLPTFGNPEAQLPQQKTMAPVTPAPTAPEFFSPSRGAAAPRRPDSAASSTTGRETPLYTTGTGSTTGGTMSADDLGSSASSITRTETPLYTTLDLPQDEYTSSPTDDTASSNSR